LNRPIVWLSLTRRNDEQAEQEYDKEPLVVNARSQIVRFQDFSPIGTLAVLAIKNVIERQSDRRLARWPSLLGDRVNQITSQEEKPVMNLEIFLSQLE
jgi:hypothetical protein